jgi:hypothetical protein
MINDTLITVHSAMYTVCKYVQHTVFKSVFLEEGYTDNSSVLVALFSTNNQQYGLVIIPVEYCGWKEYIDHTLSNKNCVFKLRLFSDPTFKIGVLQTISMTTVYLTVNEEAFGISWLDTETNIKKEYLKIALQVGEKNGY